MSTVKPACQDPESTKNQKKMIVSSGMISRILGVSRPHVARLAELGVIREIRVGKAKRYHVADATELLLDADARLAAVRKINADAAACVKGVLS